MKTFIFTTKSTKANYSIKKEIEIYWVNNNHPTNVASATFYMASTRGEISEAMMALARARIIDAKYDESYYSEAKDKDFEIIELA